MEATRELLCPGHFYQSTVLLFLLLELFLSNSEFQIVVNEQAKVFVFFEHRVTIKTAAELFVVLALVVLELKDCRLAFIDRDFVNHGPMVNNLNGLLQLVQASHVDHEVVRIGKHLYVLLVQLDQEVIYVKAEKGRGENKALRHSSLDVDFPLFRLELGV